VGFVVILKEPKDERSLPIFIGAAEAQAIAIQLNNVQLPRPLTHDLLKSLLDFLECRVMRIEICDLKEGTFFARLVMEKDGRPMEMDCRPSDAIALALRCGAPVFVSAAVMNEAGRVIEVNEEENHVSGAAPESPGEGAEAPHRSEKKEKRLSPLDILNRRLARAVREEKYEDAARLRDEIKRLKQTHTDN
jgi:bifunctional DNase/RNase